MNEIAYRCGCFNEVHGPSGVLRSVSRCPRHKAAGSDPVTLGEAYYAEFGVIKDGRFAATDHVAQLEEALGLFGPADCPLALEIGCGVSPYYHAIRAAGYSYTGLDPSSWASEWMLDNLGAGVIVGKFEDVPIDSQFGLILAAHSIEHMVDAPGAITRCADLLVTGGELWIIVPDDSDPVNPDHLFFFTELTLRSCLESAGMVVNKMAVRKYVEHESFIYAKARRPS